MYFGLDATNENIFGALQENLLDRNSDITRFITILDAIGGGRSIAIDGAWGSGKTFFVKQCKMVLDANNPVSKMPPISSTEEPMSDEHLRQSICKQVGPLEDISLAQSCFAIYYDAWANDSDIDPLISLVYDIARNIDEEYRFEKSSNMREIAADIIGLIINRDLRHVIEDLRKSSSLDTIEKRHELQKSIDEFLDSLVVERGNHIIIFIDELDRCNPRFAVEMLERIKHYFANENISFVFSVNLSQLEHTVKAFYGNQFNAGKYLDRFFDLRLSLPPANIENYYTKIGLNKGTYIYENACLAAVKYFGMDLRETARFYQTAKIAAYNSTHTSKSFFGRLEQAELFSNTVIVPFLIALRMNDNSRYEAFISGKGVDDLIDYVTKSNFLITWINRRFLEKADSGDYAEMDYKAVVKAAYDAIFVNDYAASYDVEAYGMEFNRWDKNEILRRVSCFSNDVNLD